ncbi:MAG TPA: VWA domain-containing protein [Acidimicrobiia bacterium]
MLSSLADFAAELRTAGVPVSMVEVVDAAAAIDLVDLGDRSSVRTALAATMVKTARHQPAFDTAFDVFFGLTAPPPPVVGAAPSPGDPGISGEAAAGAAGGEDIDRLVEALVEAVRAGDADRLLELVRQAVDRFAGFRPGQPSGGRYYAYRVMSRLDVSRLRSRFTDVADVVGGDDDFARRIVSGGVDEQVERIRRAVQDEIVRRLVADRGRPAVARTLRDPLVEDIDLMHATREELAMIEARVAPLARKLASRLSARRRHGRRGRLDARRTIRRSLAHGGALIDPRWKPRRITKPELVMLCDVSGSMATFARFTMQLTYAIGHQFSNVRSFAFVDGIDEVTRFFAPGVDFDEAMRDVAADAEVIRQDGHSDYGAALHHFAEHFGDAVTARSTVIVTGDARNNYRDAGVDVLAAIAERARAVHWLNPESPRYWDTGDSIMSTFSPLCDGVHEVRTLRQLERFVEHIALDRTHRGRRPPVR